jgi:hypothetical protein
MPSPIDLEDVDSPELLIASMRLTKDLRDAARILSPQQQRILVDLYYQVQDGRKRSANQMLAAKQEPNAWVTMMSGYLQRLEKLVAGALDISTNEAPVSRWAKAQTGVGPVLTAALAAYIDIRTTPSVSALWSLAGQNPLAVWNRGEKRPWNAALKVVAWKLGDSFVKFHNHKDCLYGHIYAARKRLEVERNEAYAFRPLAEKTLANKKIKDVATRKIYEAGQLPAGRLELRARRVATKLFLSHYWNVAYYEEYHRLPAAQPYIFAKDPTLHTQYIPPPGYEEVFVWQASR